MELWQSIIIKTAKKYEVDFMDLKFEKLFEKECYKLLERIKGILEDDSIEDENCFYRIEKLVCLFEEIGSNCGSRHDFG